VQQLICPTGVCGNKLHGLLAKLAELQNNSRHGD